jgi:transcriptional regulator with XRE-family HTH domain
MNNIGNNIKIICREKNINMMRLAEDVDMSYEYLRQIVSPKGKKQLSFYSIYKFSIFLDTPIDELIKKKRQ